MAAFPPDARPHAVDGLEVTEAEDGLVIFDPEADRVAYLNATASAVFVLCDGGTRLSAIVDAVAATFALDEPPTEAVESALQQLIDERLVTVHT